MKKFEIAKIFNATADILELMDDNPFRIRAYRRAAQNVENLPGDIEEIAKRDELAKIPGVGSDLAEKIKWYLATGNAPFYEDLKKKIPPVLLDLINVPGIGPKTAKLLQSKLKVKSIKDLEQKAKKGEIQGLPGIKEKTVENILRGIELVRRGRERMPLAVAQGVAEEIVQRINKLPEVKEISPAGSLRRMKETVRDIDILVTTKNPQKVMKVFTNLPQVAEVLAHGETKSSILTKDKVQVDLRVVEEKSYGAALCYFTGSKEHNIRLRKMAQEKGLKLNEYGIFNERTGRRLAGEKEKDVYGILKMDFVPAELREDRGEIEAALKKKLPRLVGLTDIKGDFHVHSNWSDGFHSIEELAEAAKRMGYEFIVVSDHSKTLKVAGGLSDKDLLKKTEAIRKLNKKLKGITLLAGAEVDILGDGELDYKDELLKELDFVVAAIHSGFKQSKEILTKRTINAMKNKYVHLIAHPTGRLLGTRDPYEIDLEEVFKVALDTNTALEINAYPDRLDLNDVASHRARELGVTLAIATDAHTQDQMKHMRFGVSVARRGWLEIQDILNTLSVTELLKKIKK